MAPKTKTRWSFFVKKQFPIWGNGVRMRSTTRGTTEAAVRKRFALSGVVAFALIGVVFALKSFGPISLSQQVPQAAQEVMSVRVERAGWTSPNCPAGTSWVCTNRGCWCN
jgi:hypothetical protein